MLAQDVESRPQSAERVGIGAIGERCGQEDAVLIQAVVKTLQRSKDVAAISAFESMTALAHHERNRSHFVALGGIPLVLGAMQRQGPIRSNERQKVLQAACRLLPVLALSSECSELLVRDRGLKILVKQFAICGHHVDIQQSLANCFRCMTVHGCVQERLSESEKEMFRLVTAMNVGQKSSSFSAEMCLVLASLATHQECKVLICHCGGLSSIAHAMLAHEKDAQVQANACFALRNLSDHTFVQNRLLESDCIRLVLCAMKAHPQISTVQDQACRALANLAANNADAQLELVTRGGVLLILQGMDAHQIYEQATVALCNIGWDQRKCLDTIKDLGGQEKIERVVALPDASELTIHWGRVLLEKLQYAGVQRGLLVSEDDPGLGTLNGRRARPAPQDARVGESNYDDISEPRKESGLLKAIEEQQQLKVDGTPDGPSLVSPARSAAEGACEFQGPGSGCSSPQQILLSEGRSRPVSPFPGTPSAPPMLPGSSKEPDIADAVPSPSPSEATLLDCILFDSRLPSTNPLGATGCTSEDYSLTLSPPRQPSKIKTRSRVSFNAQSASPAPAGPGLSWSEDEAQSPIVRLNVRDPGRDLSVTADLEFEGCTENAHIIPDSRPVRIFDLQA